MEQWAEIRRRVLTGELSKREACREYELHWQTLKKILAAAEFVLTLPHSDAFFVRAFPKECTESFQDGHVRAFEHLGGVPTRISYDNSKVAVAAITGHRGRTPTREFLRLASHYLFAYRF